MRVLAFLILILVLAACCSTVLSTPPSDNAKAAWTLVCHYGPYSCKNVPAPHVVLSTDFDRRQIYGLYVGGDTIYTNATHEGTKQELSTLIHEMLHYLQTKTKYWVPALNRCEMEEEAHNYTEAILTRIGRLDLPHSKWDLSRQLKYGCMPKGWFRTREGFYIEIVPDSS